MTIRTARAHDQEEIFWLAVRMRRTLMEVLGDEPGEALYTMEWLEQRVRYHLDPLQCLGQIFLAVTPDQERIGYTIVRREEPTLGLFSTTYVEPGWRRGGVAQALLRRGEDWMRQLGLSRAATYTSGDNHKLQQLYLAQGYRLSAAENGFVQLLKQL